MNEDGTGRISLTQLHAELKTLEVSLAVAEQRIRVCEARLTASEATTQAENNQYLDIVQRLTKLETRISIYAALGGVLGGAVVTWVSRQIG